MSDINTHDRKTGRGGLALRGALAAGTATAVLMGGFGAFSLWNDSIGGGPDDDIATGELAIQEVNPATDAWRIVGTTDGVLATGSPIDASTFKASPGDTIAWTGEVVVSAKGSDMLAELSVDESSLVALHPSLQGLVTVTVTDADGDQTVNITASEAGVLHTEPVTVQIAFSDAISDAGTQNLAAAVDLDGLQFSVTQVH